VLGILVINVHGWNIVPGQKVYIHKPNRHLVQGGIIAEVSDEPLHLEP